MTNKEPKPPAKKKEADNESQKASLPAAPAKPAPAGGGEVGGRGGLDPTRYGDWEIGGRCVDF